MKLYLMRHGQAASPQVDPEQGLSSAGRADIEHLAQQLAGQGVQFAQVFHSDKARARQTAEIMAGAIAPGVKPQQLAGLKPNDDPRELLPKITDWQVDTLITSHLPFIPALLIQLVKEPAGMDFLPGSVICLAKNDNKDWQIEWAASP